LVLVFGDAELSHGYVNRRGWGDRKKLCEFYRYKIHLRIVLFFEEMCLAEDHHAK